MNDKQLVTAAVDALLVNRDPLAVDRYFGPGFTEHGPLAGGGTEGLREWVSSLPPAYQYERFRVLAQDDLVAVHGRYRGLGDAPLIAFDLYRVSAGRVVEHWAGMQPETRQTASGHTMVDGPTEITEPAATDTTRNIVEGAVQAVLIEGDFTQLARYWNGDAYIQHNPRIPDTVSGLAAAFAALAAAGESIVVTRRHRTVAEGEFAVTQSEGTDGETPVAFYDLFRVEKGFIAEHWDVVSPIPPDPPHANGPF
jgi:predicted SnoaL-like aldol condensation-catalyzing enzyme